MDLAIKVLQSLGNRTSRLDFPGLDLANEVGAAILGHEAYGVHHQWLQRDAQLYGDTCRLRLQAGANVGEEAYAEALRRQQHLRARIDRLFETFDVLAMPVTFGAAAALDDPEGLRRSGDVSFRLPFNVTGHPALVFCTGFNTDGLPLSMQVVGRHGEDERLLDLAISYQQVTAWHDRHPSSLGWNPQPRHAIQVG